MPTDKAPTGLAGEFYVLAQLAHRGLVGTMTLSNTKGVDILVCNQGLDTLYKVEVKTTDRKPTSESLFGEKPFFGWVMSSKHERLSEPSLFYCFVALQGVGQLPRFFIVPSAYVAKYVREQHAVWLVSRKPAVPETTMRRFRIPVDDPEHFEGAWDVFSK
jgi:hypothetical protein